MEKHLTALSALFAALGVCGVLVAGVVLVALTGGGLLSGDRVALLVTSGIGMAIAGLLVVLSLPALVAGIGLYQRRPWSRLLGLILACLQLLNLPVGTVLGVYALWVLLHEDTARLLGGEPRSTVQVV
jgi:hypothetical protein